ncbi:MULTISPECIES: Bug family tripartite tricarboxylate transporter substrate binding protein [unclassified Variovorax]|uniref:Bug family tripartite tricarboxylate transporter substrate binding protein n=1 Tax=unclassified Variovorax TaxID=663243 RepID=UPI000D11D83D|nr:MULTISPECIES: tripartite tricarboxylate transporter substrate binding protein [unclassified Variovorax]AVQ85054.1 tripartite tricarboxylate transporter substrate binding protein [Variovorax sp. PMC12]QRY34671.1 tripartite tricarboxylate transporter substrate binding protein [Variovorax sp. PDNC026]
MPQPITHISRILIGAALAAVAAATAYAQASYPSRPVRLVVSQAPGGSSDTIARLWAEHAGKAIGATIVVENKPGAGGLIAAQNALNAPADGYTLLLGSVSLMVLNQFTYKPLPYNPEKDFVGVSMLTTVPFVLSANPATGIKTLKDLTEKAKAAPGKLNFASAGLGNSTHLAVELVDNALGISMTHIPYKGEADGVLATIGGQTEVMAPVYGTALPHIKNHKLNPLAVLAPQRTPELPDVPTLGELGVKGFDNMGWSAVVARAGTPADIVEKLNKATQAFHKSPDVQAKLKSMGVIPLSGPSALVMETTVRDAKAWGPTLEALNLSAK